MKKFLSSLWEIAEVVIVAGASILIIYGFVAQPFLVQGSSMEPNFHNNNYLIVDELTYRFREPQRDEVIVFVNPTNNKNEYYIKRIIGLPGERVVIKGNQVSVDGNRLPETYLSLEDQNFSNTVDVTLKKDEYFVMGDNRPHSFDSRNWGPLHRSYIVGMVRLRFWPLTEFTFFREAELEQAIN